MTVFPKGPVHTVSNQQAITHHRMANGLYLDDVHWLLQSQLISVLSSEDPETFNIFNSAAYFPDQMINAVLQRGQKDQTWSKLKGRI
jgi:hypothetical protein